MDTVNDSGPYGPRYGYSQLDDLQFSAKSDLAVESYPTPSSIYGKVTTRVLFTAKGICSIRLSLGCHENELDPYVSLRAPTKANVCMLAIPPSVNSSFIGITLSWSSYPLLSTLLRTMQSRRYNKKYFTLCELTQNLYQEHPTCQGYLHDHVRSCELSGFLARDSLRAPTRRCRATARLL